MHGARFFIRIVQRRVQPWQGLIRPQLAASVPTGTIMVHAFSSGPVNTPGQEKASADAHVAPAAGPVDFNTFSGLGVPGFWQERLAKAGILLPTETQKIALPLLMGRHHVVLHAETGTGKTLCYLLPMLDALRLALQGHDRSRQLLPVGLVVVPTAELAAQVHAVAAALLPEQANIMRICHGTIGVSRRQNAGILIATPVGLRDNMSTVMTSKLQVLVLDEADALLTSGGEGGEAVRGLLERMKRTHPAERPMHVFCAATLPNRGKSSVASFLDKYYAEPEVKRIVSEGKHKPLPRVAQVFWQLDAGLPLTSFERESAARQQARIDSAVKNANEPSSRSSGGGGVGGGVGEGEEESDEMEDDDNCVAEEGEDDDIGDGESIGSLDRVSRTMEGRAAEDTYLGWREEESRYRARVASLRRAAVMEALLQPARLAGVDVERESVLAQGGAVGAGTSRKRDGFHPSAQMGFLQESPPPKERQVKAAARMAVEDARSALDDVALNAAIGAAPVPTLIPFIPRPTGRSRMTAAQCALIPPTLIFVNTVEAAVSLRAFIAGACSYVRVSELHSKVPEAARAARVSDFAADSIRILVCTDLAARGLDTSRVRHVIQAQFAGDAIGHIHRVGRTARAGRAGVATSLIIRDELARARGIVEASRTGASLETVFSRRRSLRKRTKRGAIVAAEEEAIMDILETEMKAVQAQARPSNL